MPFDLRMTQQQIPVKRQAEAGCEHRDTVAFGMPLYDTNHEIDPNAEVTSGLSLTSQRRQQALIIIPAVASSDSALARSAGEEGVSTCSISSLARRAGVPES